MRVEVYLNDAEYNYVKSKQKGFVRHCVQKQMADVYVAGSDHIADASKMVVDKPHIEELKGLKIKGVEVGVANLELNQNLPKEWKCTKCGKRLPYFKATKCKLCGNKMKWS